MKRLLLAAFAVGLIGCAQQPASSPGPAVTGGYTYDRYARSAEAWGHPNPVYKNWTTEQLQKRRFGSLRSGSLHQESKRSARLHLFGNGASTAG